MRPEEREEEKEDAHSRLSALIERESKDQKKMHHHYISHSTAADATETTLPKTCMKCCAMPRFANPYIQNSRHVVSRRPCSKLKAVQQADVVESDMNTPVSLSSRATTPSKPSSSLWEQRESGLGLTHIQHSCHCRDIQACRMLRFDMEAIRLLYVDLRRKADPQGQIRALGGPKEKLGARRTQKREASIETLTLFFREFWQKFDTNVRAVAGRADGQLRWVMDGHEQLAVAIIIIK
eukprot:scaffold147562_cov42-Attheya_sp.AAC.1